MNTNILKYLMVPTFKQMEKFWRFRLHNIMEVRSMRGGIRYYGHRKLLDSSYPVL